jgi:hypothetical protein
VVLGKMVRLGVVLGKMVRLDGNLLIKDITLAIYKLLHFMTPMSTTLELVRGQ